MSNASLGYTGIMRLAKEHADWLPIAEECVRSVKAHNGETTGYWVLHELKQRGWVGKIRKDAPGLVIFFPGLRTLVAYDVLKHELTNRRGKRAYYSMPDAQGV